MSNTIIHSGTGATTAGYVQGHTRSTVSSYSE